MSECAYVRCTVEGTVTVKATYRSPGGRKSTRTVRVCTGHQIRATRELSAIGYLVHTDAADRRGAGIGLTACCTARMDAGHCSACGNPATWASLDQLADGATAPAPYDPWQAHTDGRYDSIMADAAAAAEQTG